MCALADARGRTRASERELRCRGAREDRSDRPESLATCCRPPRACVYPARRRKLSLVTDVETSGLVPVSFVRLVTRVLVIAPWPSRTHGMRASAAKDTGDENTVQSKMTMIRILRSLVVCAKRADIILCQPSSALARRSHRTLLSPHTVRTHPCHSTVSEMALALLLLARPHHAHQEPSSRPSFLRTMAVFPGSFAIFRKAQCRRCREARAFGGRERPQRETPFWMVNRSR